MTAAPDFNSTISRTRGRSATTLLLWHGYLLSATGSNIYTHHLVDSWVRAGHDVVLACQDRDASHHPRIHRVVELSHDQTAGLVRVSTARDVRTPEPGHGTCTLVIPDIHGLLPVYVLDRYAGFEVVRVPGLDAARRERYARDHAAAMQWVLDRFAPDGVLINHASPLPAAVGPVLVQAGVPYAVKVHGSELEYALAEDASLVAPAASALRDAAAVLVGSAHIEQRTRALLGDACVDGRAATVPPGVDLTRFVPIERSPEAREAARGELLDALRARQVSQPDGRRTAATDEVRHLVAGNPAQLIDGLRALHGTYEERHIEADVSTAIARVDPQCDALIMFVGKLIPQKGVHLLIAALPRVLEQHPDAQLVVCGFGPLRDGLEALAEALSAGNAAAIAELAARLGELSGEGGAGLPHLSRYIEALRERGELDAWLELGRRVRVADHVTFLGLVDHGVLGPLWPTAQTSVVPSILAEAFGMVAAEAAASGCVPLVSDHSGLADAAAVIELNDVAPLRVNVDQPATAIDHLADALIARLDLTEPERARQAAQARANVAAAWGWDHIATHVASLMTPATRR